MEKGDLSLEKSLKVFEEGVLLSKKCAQLLNEAEKKVELLIHDKDGKLEARPYPPYSTTKIPEETETFEDGLEPENDSEEGME
jgi:exodeoxyribonuclease VII small subunit